MDHNYAVENHTAERYLLQELPEDDRDAYEEHFFTCSVCAEEVKSASEFIECARQVVQDELNAEIYGMQRASRWGSWLNWRIIMQPIPAMACTLLVVVLGFSAYQNRVTELRMESAQVITSEPVILHHARSSVPLVRVENGKSFVLRFDITPSSFSAYEASVLTQTDARKLSPKKISAQDAMKPIEMVVPGNILKPGKYVLLIEGVDGRGKTEVERFAFDLRY
jgi:hypothetical protein